MAFISRWGDEQKTSVTKWKWIGRVEGAKKKSDSKISAAFCDENNFSGPARLLCSCRICSCLVQTGSRQEPEEFGQRPLINTSAEGKALVKIEG